MKRSTVTVTVTSRHVTRALAFAMAAASTMAFAQYKVVGPDGRITYTDRAPASTEAPGARVSTVRGPAAGTSTIDVALPLDLRQATQKFPVTLYVSTDCEPCAAGRQMLRARGVPFAERTVASNDDQEALQRLAGSRDVPVLTIGGQTLRGLSTEVWAQYLDAAGYPRESRLPANYVYAAASPMVRQATAPTPAATPAPAAPPAPAPAAPADTGGIRF